MDKIKTRDIVFRVLSILISMILWLYVASVENPLTHTEITGIPVKLVNTDAVTQAGFVMINGESDLTVKLSVKGRKKDIMTIKPQDFKAEANLGSGNRIKGINSVLVDIKDYPGNVTISEQPAYINVELDELLTKSFPLRVDVTGQAKQGYSNKPASVKPAEVIIKGAARFIGSINSVVTKVDIKDAAADIQTSMPIEVLDKNGKTVSDIEVTPKTADISIPIRKAKDVTINIKTSGKLPVGTTLKAMAVTPQKITITGEDKVIDSITSIDTMPVSLDGVTLNTTKNVKLNIPDGILVVSGSQNVNVDISVETKISKTYSVSIKYANLPDGLKADLIANTINVTLLGQESLINSIQATDLSALIDLSSAPQEDGEYEFVPSVTYPQGVELKDISLQKVRVKITKKQG